MRTLLILGLLLLAVTGQAQYLHPEYQTLTEDRMKDFYDPRDVSMEYESDFFSFFPNFKYLNAYYQSENSFVGSVGSLGKKNFMLRQGAKFRTALSDRVGFGFQQLGEEDFESQYRSVIFEFLYWSPDREKALVVFGEAAYQKGEDDIGIALEHKKEDTRGRLYTIFSDYSRNRRGVGTDKLQNTPVRVGFLWEKFPSKHEFTRFHASWQFNTTWEFPDEGATYLNRQGQVQLLQRIAKDVQHYRHRLIFLEDLTQKSVGVYQKDRRVFRWMESAEINRIEAGLWYANHYFTLNDSALKYNFFQPFIWLSKKGPEAEKRWRLGISAVIGDRDDGETGFLPEDSGDEYRVTFAWQSKPVEVHFGFDFDRVGESDMWEGGNVQVQTDF